MRTPGYALPGKALITATTALLMLVPLLAQAQSQRDNYYRAEIVIVERIVKPENVRERMASRVPETIDGISQRMTVVREDGSIDSSLSLAPDNELHLRSAAQRLENSGRYRVLMSAGWYQSYPPDYEGQPMRVEIGDWLADAGHREVEGHITIDRQRYLHVGVHLNHWQPSESSVYPIQEQGPAALASRAELLTWIRETRRMRSEEVHFLDSPTIGVLVFFKRIEG
ncbi:CsiV family protein [Marinobacter sp.]|uniref:CsiV family protein n=1 Tax=Marinobacter sp. TaxID=50741 RepID=UPI0034A3CA53